MFWLWPHLSVLPLLPSLLVVSTHRWFLFTLFLQRIHTFSQLNNQLHPESSFTYTSSPYVGLAFLSLTSNCYLTFSLEYNTAVSNSACPELSSEFSSTSSVPRLTPLVLTEANHSSATAVSLPPPPSCAPFTPVNLPRKASSYLLWIFHFHHLKSRPSSLPTGLFIAANSKQVLWPPARLTEMLHIKYYYKMECTF